MYVCFTSITDFVFISYIFRASHLSFQHLIDRLGVMHEAGYVDSIRSA